MLPFAAVTSSYVELSNGRLAMVALLLIVCGVISMALRLGMERTLAVAGVRTMVQLLLIGVVLQWVFRVDRWYVVVALMSLMTLVASLSAVQRTDRRYRGMWLDSIVSIWVSSWMITAFAVFVIVRPEGSWCQPQYLIPLLGMMLGNVLTGVSLGLGRLTEELTVRRNEVESLLALGATRWEAARLPVAHAVRTGMIPVVNSMMVVGLVSLPGMMTGQLIAGADPLQAVRYQIVIMFLLAATVSLGTVSVILLGYRRLFSPNHQFLQIVHPKKNASLPKH